MPTVILVNKAGLEFPVTNVQGFIDAVYSRGALPKTGSVRDNYEALQQDGPPPVENGNSFVTLNDLKSATSPAGLAQRAAFAASETGEIADGAVAAIVGTKGTVTRTELEAALVPQYTAKQAVQYRTLQAGARLEEVLPYRFAPVTDPGRKPLTVKRGIRGQKWLGVGAAISDAAAWVLQNYLSDAQRHALLAECFSPVSEGGQGWNMVRVTFGGTGSFRSPNAPAIYTYNDTVGNAADPDMAQFSVQPDTLRVMPVVREIVGINPALRVHATISNYPTWLEEDGIGASNFRAANGVNASLDDTAMSGFAKYCVKAVQAWEAYGIPIDTFCPVNEAYRFSGFSVTAISDFVNNYLGPAFRDAGIRARIVLGEDSYHLAPTVRDQLNLSSQWVDGVSWHPYSDPPEALRYIAQAHPGKFQFVSEIRNMLAESWAEAWGVMMGRSIIGPARYGSSATILWNLALDPTGEPSSGFPGRQGVFSVPTDSSGAYVRNTGYFALAHVSRFVQPGATRIDASTWNGAAWLAASAVMATAFENPDGTVALIAYNPGPSTTFTVYDSEARQGFPVTMGAGEVSTFVWGSPAFEATLGAVPPAVSVPAAPTVTATAQNGQVALAWTDVSATQYRVFRGGVKIATLDGGALGYTDSRPAAGTWSYQVYAVNPAGQGPAGPASATTAALAAPGAPTNVQVTVIGSRVKITWDQTATDQVDRFIIARSPTSGSTGSTRLTASGGARSVTDVATAGTYYYTVQAANATGTTNSAQSSAAAVTDTSIAPKPGAVSYHKAPSAQKTSYLHPMSASVRNAVALVTVNLSAAAATATGVTFNGKPMTLLGSAAASNRVIALFGVAAGDLTNGYYEIVAATAKSLGSLTIVECLTLADVDQTSPFRTAVTGIVAPGTSLTIATTGGAASDLVVAAIVAATAVTPGGGQVRRDETASSTGVFPAITTQPGGTETVNSSFTFASANAAGIAVPVKAWTP